LVGGDRPSVAVGERGGVGATSAVDEAALTSLAAALHKVAVGFLVGATDRAAVCASVVGDVHPGKPPGIPFAVDRPLDLG
jgi:hypothetical protein